MTDPQGQPVINQSVALELSLARRMSIENQPAVKAARTSLAAAVARHQGLENLRVPRFLARDLPLRRQQACLGVSISQADVQRAEADAIYGVTYCYLSVLYTREQIKLTEEILTQLDDLADLIEGKEKGKATNDHKVEKKKPPFYVQGDEYRVTTYKNIALSRQEEARNGERRAISALKEAVGLPCGTIPLVVRQEMPRISPVVDCNSVVALAKARRPEMLQVQLAAQVTNLEVDAQKAILFRPRVPTFATGSDLHSRPLPSGMYHSDYRPAVVEPEMPAMIIGYRKDRVNQAQIYTSRADNVVEKTTNLLGLEAEQAYLRYDEAARKIKRLEPALEQARKVFASVKDRLKETTLAKRSTIREFLDAGAVVSELRSQINQQRYQMLLSLAALERVTAGGFHAGFEAPAPPAAHLPAEKLPEAMPEKGKKGMDDLR